MVYSTFTKIPRENKTTTHFLNLLVSKRTFSNLSKRMVNVMSFGFFSIPTLEYINLEILEKNTEADEKKTFSKKIL